MTIEGSKISKPECLAFMWFLVRDFSVYSAADTESEAASGKSGQWKKSFAGLR
jgi:hypothetical protein